MAEARISKLFLVDGPEALDRKGFFPVGGFLLALLRLATLVKPSWSEELVDLEGWVSALKVKSQNRWPRA